MHVSWASTAKVEDAWYLGLFYVYQVDLSIVSDHFIGQALI